MTTITVNGKTISVPSGRNISVCNGVVMVDGVRYGDDDFAKHVMEIKVAGDLLSLMTDRSVTCKNVNGIVTAGGSVSCGQVEGDVRAGGAVNCGTVHGNVSAGGSINCRK